MVSQNPERCGSLALLMGWSALEQISQFGDPELDQPLLGRVTPLRAEPAGELAKTKEDRRHADCLAVPVGQRTDLKVAGQERTEE
jgi:hypothetical protein